MRTFNVPRLYLNFVFRVILLEKSYRKTVYACYIGYITQGVVNNLAPLLFLTFINSGWATLRTVTFLTTLNFATQLAVDLLSACFVDKIGYRKCIVAAHIFCFVGLVGMASLPFILPSPFAGLLISVVLYAVGGGLLEVLVSPIVEACPSDNKAGAMSLLHSFYCWGVVAVIALSTLWLWVFGRDSWRLLCVLWSVIPLANAFLFTRVPINSLTSEGEGMSLGGLFKTKIFWIFALLMFAAGASELAMAQWASAFAESGLGIEKAVGDLAGPCVFAVLMGIARTVYAKAGSKIKLERFILFSGIMCLASYLAASLCPIPAVALLGCGVCGFSVGIMWPGVFSLASASIPKGGTALFALLALAGDLGCTGGPTFVGLVSSSFGDSLRAGLLAAIIFPIIMIAGILVLKRSKKRQGFVTENS